MRNGLPEIEGEFSIRHAVLQSYMTGFTLTKNLSLDIADFYSLHDDIRTLTHTRKVAEEAMRIANLYGENPAVLEQAALLHDISNVIPVTQMLQTADELGIPILDDERSYSRIIHQKLSKAMAEHIFLIKNSDILNAIECHTTLKAQASLIDKILFISDKISFDMPGEHLYLLEIRRCVDDGNLDKAVLIYLDTIWEQRSKLKLVHPWLVSAREELLHLIKNT